MILLCWQWYYLFLILSKNVEASLRFPGAFSHVDDNSEQIQGSFDVEPKYSDYVLVRISPNDWQLVMSETMDYDVWSYNQHFVDVMVHKDSVEQLPGKILIPNVQSAIDESRGQYHKKTNDGKVLLDDFFFDDYPSLDAIYTWLDLLAESFSDLCTVEEFGTTYNNHPLKLLHIGAHNSENNPDRKTIVLTGGIHAREWISITSVLWNVYQLITQYGKVPDITEYLDSLDFMVIPVFNPDGYTFTRNHDRLWRKNRQPTFLPQCFGVDIDHSFGFRWQETSKYPCSEEYSGEEPFESLEARYWSRYLNETNDHYKIYGFIDYHSYAEEVLYPYSYSCEAVPRDLENLLELSYGLAKAIRTQSGRGYDVVSSCKDRGSDLAPELGSGTALDYMYHQRAHWAFQLKLRDTGNHGFLLPPKYIRPVGRETFAALRYFCNFLVHSE